MKELLHLFQKPSHYLGTEPNAVHKNLAFVSVHIALAFPDLYEVGMSYYGHKILYEQINKVKDFYAERVFAPSPEVAHILKQNNVPLATLETDTPLKNLDILGFSLTNELAYTTFLYMLDLAQIPFWPEQRNDSFPLIIAGGGVTFNAEPVAPFFDLFFLGDGEKLILNFLARYKKAKKQGFKKKEFLLSLKGIEGIYIPGFFKEHRQKHHFYEIKPIYADYPKAQKHTYPNLNHTPLPQKPIVPFGKPVHDRLTLEIARGCTRGCRFCHAGFIYRPVRERNTALILKAIDKGLKATGYEELSFLSLSTGDFSDLLNLFCQSINMLQLKQVAVSLPSLRIGSVASKIMEMVASIRKTGLTLAPEAGSQRLRDVINKNITEEEILSYTEKIFSLGWQQIKLYFMIGLPTETQADLTAIYDLCQKILQTTENKRVRLTASVSLFVPKAHTPFQWARQLNLQELNERLAFLRELFKKNRRMQLKWHNPQMSVLEGIFSRGGRELACVLLDAYKQGEILSNWDDFFGFETWEQIFAKHGLDPNFYLQEKKISDPLPWDHLDCGVNKQFLQKEYQKALNAKLTPDCRFGSCSGCGVCNFKPKGLAPIINKPDKKMSIPSINYNKNNLKQEQWRLWFCKLDKAAYFSQLELQKIFERSFRRLDIALTFSKGFHPAPILSFARALPVGLESLEECLQVTLAKNYVSLPLKTLNDILPAGLKFLRGTKISLKEKIPMAKKEEFELFFKKKQNLYAERLKNFNKKAEFVICKSGKKQEKQYDLKKIVSQIELKTNKARTILNWECYYLNPRFIFQSILGDLDEVRIIKIKQFF
ncbi:MAG: TIGR03960 family B12-binding radical SAM protein [Desulfonauticus sp.]|nr:TIGR03960 family B12-binding radical SAM protein [Desulfonauticus sp.]